MFVDYIMSFVVFCGRLCRCGELVLVRVGGLGVVVWWSGVRRGC